jgi:hypothetical protein
VRVTTLRLRKQPVLSGEPDKWLRSTPFQPGVPTQAHAAWLDPEITDSARVATIVRECAMSDFGSYPVSTRVNSPRNNDEKLIERVAD